MFSKFIASFIGLWMICISLANPVSAEEPPDCTTVDQCLAILISHELRPEPGPNDRRSSGVNPKPIEKAIAKLQAFGDLAVGPLVSLLKHPLYHVRNRAAYALFHYSNIDPKYLPDLIAARDSGIAWLPVPIARTGTGEALKYLQNAFLEDPNHSSNAQVFFALDYFAERNQPFVMKQLDYCKSSHDFELCDGVIQLLNYLDPQPEGAAAVVLEIAKSEEASDAVQGLAVRQLIHLRHPFGLDVLIKNLESAFDSISSDEENALINFSTDDIDGLDPDLDIYLTLRWVSDYKNAGKRAGPIVSKFLARQDLPDSRAEAAYVLGQIEYARAAKALRLLEPEFSDDWLLAYNAVESLGRLRSRNARRLLKGVANKHWYKPVRNNAQRALNYLNGKEFELETAENDAQPPNLFVDVRYHGDVNAGEAWCGAVRGRSVYKQYQPPRFAWPSKDTREIGLVGPSKRELVEFASHHPSFKEYGPPEFVVLYGDDVIAGTDFGEFGGSIYRIDSNGDVELIIPYNANAAFRIGEELFVATGLSHLGLNNGHVWTIENMGYKSTVTRRIRLPGTPSNFYAAFKEILIVETDEGDVPIRSDGTLINPQSIEGCKHTTTSN